jgi:Flp pilus assembly protein TadD
MDISANPLKGRIRNLAGLALAALLAGTLPLARAGDLRVSLPKKSPLTPVQELNREGVKEIEHGHTGKAKAKFIKAYLLDPDDPFTLNNLGYIAELEGDADRALRYYELAASTSTEAVIDEASSRGLKGQPVAAAFRSSKVSVYATNQANFRAVALLEKGRIFEAEMVLRNALHNDSNNPFLLDSLGYVMESEGDLDAALLYYTQAADSHSDERVFLTPNKRSRGKPISEVAARNAATIREILAKGESNDARVARLNLRGVVALNHNDTTDAQKYFTDAFRLDPRNAFTLNNFGYTSELRGDRESAEMYYDEARDAVQSNERVTYASRADAEGRRVGAVAGNNEEDVESTLKAIQLTKRRSKKPIQLMLRSGESPAPTTNDIRQQPPLSVPSPPLPPPQLPDHNAAPPSGELPNPQAIPPPTPPATSPEGQTTPPQAQQ